MELVDYYNKIIFFRCENIVVYMNIVGVVVGIRDMWYYSMVGMVRKFIFIWGVMDIW